MVVTKTIIILSLQCRVTLDKVIVIYVDKKYFDFMAPDFHNRVHKIL
jgi:hypothetical protein